VVAWRKRRRKRWRSRRKGRECEVFVQGVNVHNCREKERVARTTVIIEEIDQGRQSTASGRRGRERSK
jgi:hypothetical protein